MQSSSMLRIRTESPVIGKRNFPRQKRKVRSPIYKLLTLLLFQECPGSDGGLTYTADPEWFLTTGRGGSYLTSNVQMAGN